MTKSVKENGKRFSRQSKISWWNQQKIKNTNCMVVGCGGIGSWTAIQLALLGVRKIILVDMDKIESSNLNRQFFNEDDVGKYKVEALATKINHMNSTIKYEEFTQPIESLNDEEFKNLHFVFDCLDNIKTREFLAKKCWDKKIPFIHSACSDVIGEVQLVVPKKTKQLKSYPDDMKEKDDRKSCKDFDPAVCTTNMIVASLQVDKFLDYLIRNQTKQPFIHYIRGKQLAYGES